MLESLLYPTKAEERPKLLLLIGFLYSSVAVFLSLWIFEKESSFVMVFLTVLAAFPLFFTTTLLEESKDLQIPKERQLLKEHNKAIKFFMYLFFGIVLSCVLWYVVLPSATTSYLFEKQIQTISSINNQVSGHATSSTTLLGKIFLNNAKVLVFAILFSFIYGAGAIFILTWNATVIGAAIGNFIRNSLAEYAGMVGFPKIAGYFHVVSFGLLKYIIHGIPEILAYFYGGLAGGIISVSIIRRHYRSRKFHHILMDALELILISIGFLWVAALLEVYVTPILF